MALSFLHALHLLPFEEWFIKIYLRDATMCAEEEDTSSGSFADTAVAAMGLDGAANGHLGVLNVTEIELVHNISIVCEQVPFKFPFAPDFVSLCLDSQYKTLE